MQTLNNLTLWLGRVVLIMLLYTTDTEEEAKEYDRLQ